MGWRAVSVAGLRHVAGAITKELMGEMIRSKPNKMQVPDDLDEALFRLPMTAVEERANQWRKRHFQSRSRRTGS